MADVSTVRRSSGSPLCVRVLLFSEWSSSFVSKDSFCQNVVADVRTVTMCQPELSSKPTLTEEPGKIRRMRFIGDVRRSLNGLIQNNYRAKIL